LAAQAWKKFTQFNVFFFSAAYKGFKEFRGLLVVCVDSGFKLLN